MHRLGRGNLLATLKELRKASGMQRRDAVLNQVHDYNWTTDETALFNRLTTLQDYRLSYTGEPHGELFIHWFYRDRSVDRLSKCEIFHLNMLQYFNVLDKVETIHIRCAAKGVMSGAMKEVIGILSKGKASVDFKIVPQKKSWEHDTFKECVEYAVALGKFVYYTHFKGVTHVPDSNIIGLYRNSVKREITPINVLYWCYVMYRFMFEVSHAGKPAIGPLFNPNGRTMHYNKNPKLFPKWAFPTTGHYTGSFQAFDGKFLQNRFTSIGSDVSERSHSLWVSDPYTVEQFLAMCFKPQEVSCLTHLCGSYHMYDENRVPDYRMAFDSLYITELKNICVANGTYKWIGGTDTFNWAMCKALLDLGYSVYYYAPDMDGTGVTERYMREIGVKPYTEGIPLRACFANQQSGKFFVGKCPVIQTCHSAYTDLELPVKGVSVCVSISEEIQKHLQVRGYESGIIRNGVDLQRYCSRKPLRAVPKVLSICQGDDTLLCEACAKLGWEFNSVPKATGERIWHIEDLINDADLVVGIGRSLYDAMACGRACVSWDNRKLNPFNGCGYVTADNWYLYAKTNFTGRGFPQIYTVEGLVTELRKYNPSDGVVMRTFAEKELDALKHAQKYLSLLGIVS